ncbi:MAG: two-component system response regulator BaeR, partial [Mixta calida]|nr:two-component system response regulator BaeR [Mixta calida]
MNEFTQPLILIVEDEPKIAQLMIDYLQAANYRSHHLARGDEAIAFIQQTPPDL